MPREFGRNKRVADLIQRELADVVQRGQYDTGVTLLTLSYVDVSPDLSYAKVFVTCLDTNKSKDEVVNRLNNIAGKFRHHLSKTLALRIVPKLKFYYDESVERGTYINALINSLNKGSE
ncbi:MAG: 30S ribosome-binding factor RbfA [Gammaproteobacteria bacterium]|jgi:ribosome-binding factor A